MMTYHGIIDLYRSCRPDPFHKISSPKFIVKLIGKLVLRPRMLRMYLFLEIQLSYTFKRNDKLLPKSLMTSTIK